MTQPPDVLTEAERRTLEAVCDALLPAMEAAGDESPALFRLGALELGVRYWPASGVDIAASAGFTWVRNEGHVESATKREPFGALTLRLTR